MFDSEPVDDFFHAPPVEDEGPMPWEEYALHAAEVPPAEATDAATGEATVEATVDEAIVDQAAVDAGALADWASAIEAGGQAMPAWGDEKSVEEAAFSPPPRLDDEGGVLPEPVVPDQEFPLDAFFIPPESSRLPKGLEHAEAVQGEIAEELAFRLDAMADRLRTEGFPGLLVLDERHRPVDTLLAGVLAGYLAHETEILEAEGPQ